MANTLDEMDPGSLPEGRDVRVVNKRLPVEKTKSGQALEIFMLVLAVIFLVGAVIIGAVLDVFSGIVIAVVGFVPIAIFEYKKIKKAQFFLQLEQKIQHDASQIDNYLEQRVLILKNCAKLLDKAIDLDKDTFAKIATLRSGSSLGEEERNEAAQQIANIEKSINVAVESYPNLNAHAEIADAMQQNNYLQREITAAREVYNDTVNIWNREIFSWPIGQMVAHSKGYTTRIPFATTDAIRTESKEIMF